MRTLILLQSLLILSISSTKAQETNQGELFQLLKEQDSLLFSIGFNECNLTQVDQLISDDFEFFHDKDGTIHSKNDFINTLKKNLCGSGKNMLKRKLKAGSLEVFPLYRDTELYGVLQNGVHTFGSTSARFSHLWLLEDGDWQLTRVISYAHSQSNQLVRDLEFINLSNSQMTQLLGEYQFSPDFILSIILENGKMYGDAQGEKVEILPTSETEFATEDARTKIKFHFNEKGIVSGLVMITPDGSMNAKRIKKG